MRRAFYAALLVLAVPAAPLLAAESDALAAIDVCTARLDAQLDVGYGRIAARCPELAPALERSGWAAWLPQGWKESRNDLSVGSLQELRAVVQRELATRPGSKAPRVERLHEILTGLGDTAQQRSGAWARFKKWLRSIFERDREQPDDSWLRHMISRIGISGAATEIITYIALGAMVALAGFVVFNELRVAGLLGRRRNERNRNAAADALEVRARPKWSDIENAALSDKPRLLLELIAAKLTDLNRLPPAGALTPRELANAADLRDEADRRRLSDIALAAESARYAEGGVEPSTVEAAVGYGRELLAALESRPPQDRPAGAKA
ncbi:MAG: DUF4129 domain-containing protein [Gammaproteobacteria bacterium]